MEDSISIVAILFYVVIFALMFVSMWKVFTKAGEPGWASIIPFYNSFVMLKIAGCPIWYLLMFFIPIVNIYFTIKFYVAFVKKFGQPGWHIILILFIPLIYLPYLAFANVQYEG